MKYTIEGFSQEYAQSLKKEVIINGKDGKQKTKATKIDCTDLVILRWFVDFYPNMRKFVIDGCEYAWLSHNKLKEDLPILDISKRACIDRMQKLVDFGILKYKLIKEGGTFSLYTFGENYENLIDTKDTRYAVKQHMGMQSNDIGGTRSNDIGGTRSNDIGVCSQTTTKDKSIKYSSTNNKNKVSNSTKRMSYDEQIEEYSDNEDLRQALKAFIQMRNLIKKPLTNYALKLILNNLDKLAKDDATKIDIINQSVEHSWQGVFPLKEEKTNNKADRPTYCTNESKPTDMKPVDYTDYLHDGVFDKEGYDKACAEYKALADSTRGVIEWE